MNGARSDYYADLRAVRCNNADGSAYSRSPLTEMAISNIYA
jgi:hypothetical protein